MRQLIPLLLISCTNLARAADEPLLVAAYDVAREAYQGLTKAYTTAHPETSFTLSHGCSSKAQAEHFADGGIYDRIVKRNKDR